MSKFVEEIKPSIVVSKLHVHLQQVHSFCGIIKVHRLSTPCKLYYQFITIKAALVLQASFRLPS
jgi:hypothetical protein